ncbi:hypothetical protein ABT354_06575 [Streptomyces sp. NPDC000594]|uniref:hypothetical protein n=1 Tax=Streptomyces sp. NPDC000594 TaxID=3154261 RepID=UPI00331FB310
MLGCITHGDPGPGSGAASWAAGSGCAVEYRSARTAVARESPRTPSPVPGGTDPAQAGPPAAGRPGTGTVTGAAPEARARDGRATLALTGRRRQ